MCDGNRKWYVLAGYREVPDLAPIEAPVHSFILVVGKLHYVPSFFEIETDGVPLGPPVDSGDVLSCCAVREPEPVASLLAGNAPVPGDF